MFQKSLTPIEYASEELTQHTQMNGCIDNIFLEEANPEDENLDKVDVKPTEENIDGNDESTVEQILKLSSFKEKGMISEDEFVFIKRELIKKLKEK